MSHLQLKTHGAESKPMTPVEFFTSVCPKVLVVHQAICKRIGGTYAFQLFGEGGGQWTLDYPAAVVHAGVQETADLYVEMTAADFADMLKGTLDVEKAADDGRIRITGDASLFGNLVAVLDPGQA